MEVTEISARAKYILGTAIFVVTTVASVFLVIHYNKEIASLQNYGYLGIGLIAFIAGSSVPTPISYLLLTFTYAGISTAYGAWHPALVGLAGGVCAGIGGTLVFLLGLGGRRLFPGARRNPVDEVASKTSNTLFKRFENWARRRGSLVVFLMSAMLNPAFAPMAMAMGAIRFSIFRFFLLCVAGNLVKAMITSYAGYIGVGTLLRWFGV
jgi:membrane protein DedA with SNARE-associated domain